MMKEKNEITMKEYVDAQINSLEKATTLAASELKKKLEDIASTFEGIDKNKKESRTFIFSILALVLGVVSLITSIFLKFT